MKTLNVTFTDEEFQRILEAKGSDSWHDFILKMSKPLKKPLKPSKAAKAK